MRTIIFFMITIVGFLFSCTSEKDDEINCTEEFVFILVKVTGGQLDDFYTVRKANADTIRFDYGEYPVSGWYPVLDDSFQPLLEDKKEDFHFTGLINGEVVIDQRYEIGADKCHIIRYSGPLEVPLGNK
jgi:hypothetical protein